MSTRTPFCGHCKNIGKQYNTHFTRKTPNQTSELVCPELLKKVCTDCKGRNHTFDKCPRPVSKVASTVASTVASARASANAQEPVVQQTLTEYGDQLYVLIAEYYPYRAGKITAMFLELDVEEIIELIQNPASLQKRLNEANEILDREYPWGYVDAMFKSICLHTRSSANNSDNIEVQPLDDREEYRKRVYVAHPTWPTSTINQVVEHFMKKQLSPKEIYNLFSDFERFKVEVNLTFAELNK